MGRGPPVATGGPAIVSSYGLEASQATWNPMQAKAWTSQNLSLDNRTCKQSRTAANPYRYRDGRLRPERPRCFTGIEHPVSPRFEPALRRAEMDGVLVPNSGLPQATMLSPCASPAATPLHECPTEYRTRVLYSSQACSAAGRRHRGALAEGRGVRARPRPPVAHQSQPSDPRHPQHVGRGNGPHQLRPHKQPSSARVASSLAGQPVAQSTHISLTPR